MLNNAVAADNLMNYKTTAKNIYCKKPPRFPDDVSKANYDFEFLLKTIFFCLNIPQIKCSSLAESI